MTRFRAALAGLALLASALSFSQFSPETRIKSITELGDGGKRVVVTSSRVIDTRTSLEIELDLHSAFLDLATPEQKQKMAMSLQKATELAVLGEAGRKAVATALVELAKIPPTTANALEGQTALRVVNPLSQFIAQARTVANKPGFEGLREKINARIAASAADVQGLQDPVIRATISAQLGVGDAIVEETASLLNSLRDQGVFLRIRLRHLRDDDASRRYEVRALEPLSPEDLAAISKLREQFPSDKNSSPADLVAGLVKTIKGELADNIQELKKAIDAKLDAKKAELDALRAKVLQAWSIGDQARVDAQQKLEDFASRLQGLQTKATGLLAQIGALGDQASTDTLIALTGTIRSDFQSLVQELRDLPKVGSDLWTEIENIVRDAAQGVEKEIKDAASGLKDWVGSLDKVFKESLAQAAGIAEKLSQNILQQLNFASKMQQIGESFTDVDAKPTVLTNDDGRLGELSGTLTSGDELLVSVRAYSKDDAVLKDYPAVRLYCYKIGSRTDRLITLGFFSKTEGSGLRYGVAVTDVFKMGTRKSLEANRLMSFGIGPSLAFLDQDGNDQQEFGLGLGVSFFDDRLVGGYGYNVGLGRGYYWIGFRLPVRT